MTDEFEYDDVASEKNATIARERRERERMQAEVFGIEQTDSVTLDEVPELRAARVALEKLFGWDETRRASIASIEFSGPAAKVTWVPFSEE